MRFTSTEVAAATGGRLVGPDVAIDSVSIDSRSIEPNALFVPIVAERDGHDFIAAALDAGAVAYLTERDPVGGTAVVVPDTTAALADLGRAARARHHGPVIGITGSVGKTSVKDLAAAAIGRARPTHASERSFNNELGVPLTLCNAPLETEVLIVEMGARGAGHIAALCEIASPTVGIVTMVGAVHTSEFGDLAAVATAKSELPASLPATGTAILNADNALVAAMADQTDAEVWVYSTEELIEAGLLATRIELDDELRPSFDLNDGNQTFPVTLRVRGRHQVSNALAALSASRAVGVSLPEAIRGIARAELSPWRMELTRSDSGAAVINDAYNANAISAAAALESLAALPATRRIAVLGLMAELGERHDGDHRAMATLCADLGIELIAYREPAYGAPIANDFEEVIRMIGTLGQTDAVLVKASRVAELELLAARLVTGER